MTKWKWAIAAQLPGKLFIVNENVDWFWVDRGNWNTVRHFMLYRAGLSGAGRRANADAARSCSRSPYLVPAALGRMGSRAPFPCELTVRVIRA